MVGSTRPLTVVSIAELDIFSFKTHPALLKWSFGALWFN